MEDLKETKQLTVIIATFNEEETIEKCLDGVARHAPGAEIILVHGGRDGTAAAARRWARDRGYPILALNNFGDSGKGHAIKLGITLAKGEIMIQFDADMQFSPEDIPRVAAPLLAGEADLVIGSRFLPAADRGGYRSSFFRDKGNLLVNRIVSLSAGRKVTDVTTGLKGWTKELIWDTPFRDNRFVYEMEIVLRAALKGYRIWEIPVKYFSRRGGVSGHGGGVKELWSIGRTGLQIIIRAVLIRAGMG